jgi:outer membrane protein OmpU
MAVTGGANVTYKTGKANSGDQRSFGNDSDVTFTGTGELDNGWTFVMSAAGTDNNGSTTSSYTSMTMGSLGTLTLGKHTGGAGSKYDEEVPQAYEQASDANAGGSASSNKVGDQHDSGALTYNSPKFETAGVTVSFDADYTPQADDTFSGDGGQATKSATTGEGMSLGVTVAHESGVQIGVYGAEIETRGVKSDSNSAPSDSFEGVTYVKWSSGPLAIGASTSYIDSGKTTAGIDPKDGATLRTSGGIFTNDQFSIAYNVNDNLSVSYTLSKDNYSGASDKILTAADNTVSIDTKVNSIQAAYSMGAMSVKAYNMTVTNPGYDSDAPKLSVTELALGLAF